MTAYSVSVIKSLQCCSLRRKLLHSNMVFQLPPGGPMFDAATLVKIETMTAEEKLDLIKKAMYSEEHLLKAMFKIMLIADPGAAGDIVAWFAGRVH